MHHTLVAVIAPSTADAERLLAPFDAHLTGPDGTRNPDAFWTSYVLGGRWTPLVEFVQGADALHWVESEGPAFDVILTDEEGWYEGAGVFDVTVRPGDHVWYYDCLSDRAGDA